jgi:hypothetical protein
MTGGNGEPAPFTLVCFSGRGAGFSVLKKFFFIWSKYTYGFADLLSRPIVRPDPRPSNQTPRGATNELHGHVMYLLKYGN